jgi:hypothetical protein
MGCIFVRNAVDNIYRTRYFWTTVATPEVTGKKHQYGSLQFESCRTTQKVDVFTCDLATCNRRPKNTLCDEYHVSFCVFENVKQDHLGRDAEKNLGAIPCYGFLFKSHKIYECMTLYNIKTNLLLLFRLSHSLLLSVILIPQPKQLYHFLSHLLLSSFNLTITRTGRC